VEPLPMPRPLEPAAMAALSALPLPVEPFTAPPPYEPPARIETPLPMPAFVPPPAVAAAVPVLAAPVAAATPPISDPEPPVAPVAEPQSPSAELREIAESVGATPELLTAETAVRAAPTQPDPKDRPRRGRGSRGKERNKGRGRRSAPPGGVPDPEWATSTPPTEGALAIGPTTPALQPIQPEVRIETPAPVKPVSRPSMAPVSFAALEDKRPSRAPLYAVGAVAVLVAIGGGYSVLSSRGSAPQPEAKQEETAKAEPQKPAEPPKAQPAPKAEPVKAEPPKQVEKKTHDVEPPAHSMRDRVRAVKERVEKALEERRRKREEAVASAKAKRAVEQKPAEKETFAEQTIRPAEPPKPASPPAGAISGVGDGDVMVSKDRGRTVAAVNAAYTTAAAVKDFNCPPGMQKVPGGSAAIGSDGSDDLRNFGDRALTRVELKPYCIDQYEFPNQPGKLPKVAAPYSEAEALCKNAGKRLCSEDEWEAACRGPQNLRFPYGTRYDPDACNTTDAKDNPRQTSVAGAFSRCKSGYGVWDLSGNAAEWTASPFDGQGADKTVKGGHAARPGFDDRCASRRKLAPGAHAINVGFRCCADAH
ncbi:MAG: SUMF1/EgtB/PvdO family nonheme iron enzyme, partial [Myxococcales bacterium]